MKRIAIPIKRTANPRQSNAKRKAKAFPRAYGSEERVGWIKGLPCVVCDASGRTQQSPTENAHTKTGGMSRKADADTIIPLCTAHHSELHRGAQTFERTHGLVLADVAAQIAERWEAAWL